jgi:hypothetical protein
MGWGMFEGITRKPLWRSSLEFTLTFIDHFRKRNSCYAFTNYKIRRYLSTWGGGMFEGNHPEGVPWNLPWHLSIFFESVTAVTLSTILSTWGGGMFEGNTRKPPWRSSLEFTLTFIDRFWKRNSCYAFTNYKIRRYLSTWGGKLFQVEGIKRETPWKNSLETT